MSDDATVIDRARREASEWFTRLHRQTVTTQELFDFRTWRRAAPQNDRAYTDLEEIWRSANNLLTDAELTAATEAAEARPKRKGLPGYLVGPAARTVVALLFVALAAGGYATVTGLAGKTYETATGEQRLLRLEDGSRVRLDTESKIRVRFRKSEREIVLARGQAFFEVAHDAARPFWVEADHARVRAIGTRFDVRRRAGDVQVTLVEGRVQVTGQTTGAAWTLAPGQQITLGKTISRPQARAVEVGATTSWTTGRLVFRAVPLSAAVAEVNRYSRTKLTLEAGELNATPVTGSFETGDTEAFIAAVTDLYGLKAERGRDGAILLRPTAS